MDQDLGSMLDAAGILKAYFNKDQSYLVDGRNSKFIFNILGIL